MKTQNRTVTLHRYGEILQGHLSKYDKDLYIFFPFQQTDEIPKPIFVDKDGTGENGWIVEDWQTVLKTKGVVSE